ncbi:Calcium uniporter protein 5 [Hibiscus syriacus]|uniref:Calcium uniporter protein 5 n=1 Tax=Hibiscus syriacus TaxID=106335 RepID=A0A6A2ZDZ8_HIBSY|nr:Calcium uniporter protein 5 [Hibiscus syriacus]
MWRRLRWCEALKQGVSVAVEKRPPLSPRNPLLLERMTLKVWLSSSSSNADTTFDSKKKGVDQHRTYFPDKVYLHPEKVVDLIRSAVPLALSPEDDDPVRDELKRLQEKKEEIDVQAHKQVRRHLEWSDSSSTSRTILPADVLGILMGCMEPIAFFTTATGIVIGYAYFIITSRDPTYQDLLKRLFCRGKERFFKKHNLDLNRLKELQNKCKSQRCLRINPKPCWNGCRIG